MDRIKDASSKESWDKSNLEELLHYKNLEMLKRFEKQYSQNSLDSELIFSELMKFLWLAELHERELKKEPYNPKLQFKCAILDPMNTIDNMWHTFLLFTQDYFDFCNKFFGKYIHHNPAPLTPDKLSSNEIINRDCTYLYLDYIYNKLGEKSFKIWFSLI